MIGSEPRMKKSEQEVRSHLEGANADELKKFATGKVGDPTDITLELTWTEDEVRALARQIVAERGAK